MIKNIFGNPAIIRPRLERGPSAHLSFSLILFAPRPWQYSQACIELAKIGIFESALLDSFNATQTDLMGVLNGGDWGDDIEATLKAAVAEFKASGSW